MRHQRLLALFPMALLGRAVADDATPVSNNPAGVVYEATLPEMPFFTDAALTGNVKGYISAEAPADGNGVRFTVKFENLPKDGGPFTYHLHLDPASDGNCTSTLAHLDPFNRGESLPCDASNPASCQVGDLSGKYGKITSDPFSAKYTDPFTSTKEGEPAFFGNRSFVLHYANKTRLTCANFVKLDVAKPSAPVNTSTWWYTVTAAPTASATTSPSGAVGTASLTTVGTVSATPITVPFPGAAPMNKHSISLVGGVAVATLFALW